MKDKCVERKHTHTHSGIYFVENVQKVLDVHTKNRKKGGGMDDAISCFFVFIFIISLQGCS